MLPIFTFAAALATGPGPAAAPTTLPAVRSLGFHAVAYVNDDRSHGQVGDGLLSVNEAIRLHNGTLSFNQLSLAELGQLSLIPGTGSTTDVTWIDIDGTSTPIITVEQDLDPIVDTTFGCLIKGFNEPPTFDFSGANITHGFRVPANSANFEDLILFGGPYGIDATQTDVSGQVGIALDNVTFDGQSQFGLRVTGTLAGGVGRTILGSCRFTNLPTAVIHRELAAGRTTIFESFGVEMTNVGDGYDSALGAGGTARFTLDRQDLTTAGTAIRIDRGATADRITLVEGTHVRIRAATGAVLTNASTGLTQVALRMWHIDGGTTAFDCRSTAMGVVEDGTFAGAFTLQTPQQPLPVELRNVQFRNGAVYLTGVGANGPRVTDARFVACQLSTSSSYWLDVIDSSFESSVAAAPPGGLLNLTRCAPIAAGPGVVQMQPRPAPFVGSMTVQPERVAIGGTVTLAADLPPGTFGVFALGFTDPFPQLLAQPLHAYTMPWLTFVLPGVYRNQQQYAWNVPFDYGFVGFDLCAQIAVLPDPGTSAQPVHLPPGRRFVLR
ncbi:MAG: hypothetical protein RL398_701 [Planctomycetota bacterium]|jgi:hypothetical protein